MLINGVQHYVSGDAAYVIRPFMMIYSNNACLAEAQLYFNKRMSQISAFFEHEFKDIKQYFTHIDFVRKGQISVNSVRSLVLCCSNLAEF